MIITLNLIFGAKMSSVDSACRDGSASYCSDSAPAEKGHTVHVLNRNVYVYV